MRAYEMLTIVEAEPTHFGLTIEQRVALKLKIDRTFVQKTSDLIFIIGPDGTPVEKDFRFVTNPAQVLFHDRFLTKDPIDQVSMQFHEYGGLIGLEKNEYGYSAPMKKYLIDNIGQFRFAQLGEYRVKPADGGSEISAQSPSDILSEIIDRKYVSDIASGNLPDPDFDPAKFDELQNKVKLAVEVYCSEKILSNNPKYAQPCAVLKSVETRMSLQASPIIRGAQGPLKSMGFLIARPECEYWGSAEAHAKLGVGKRFLKALVHMIAYPILQIKAGVQMAFEFYAWGGRKSDGTRGVGVDLPPPYIGYPMATFVAIPTAMVSGIVAMMYEPVGVSLGLIDATGKAFGNDGIIERSEACKEKGWFND